MKEFYVYILRCSDSSFYTGITNDYQKRFAEHAEGIDSSCYTFKRRPIELVYVATFREVTDAIAFEKQVKGWSRKKKEALIRGEYESLPALSKKHFHRVTLSAPRVILSVPNPNAVRMRNVSKDGHAECIEESTRCTFASTSP